VKDKLGKTLYLGSYAEIPVYVHWTFAFTFLFALFLTYKEGFALINLFWYSTYIISIFLCVILHEFGHALAAKRYGVSTKDIIISPIGGVARLKGMPKKPIQELVIAIAGPLVNVAIAILLFLLFSLVFSGASFFSIIEENASPIGIENFLCMMVIINIGLFVFNLFPAFPMDGGRILRALLAMKFGKLKATRIASFIGQSLAIIMVVYAIWIAHPTLIFIGGFVYLMAGMENKQTEIQDKLQRTMVHEIMEKNFMRIYGFYTLDKVQHLYANTENKNFLVFNDKNEVIGSLPQYYIDELTNSKDNLDSAASTFMSSLYGFFQWDQDVETVFRYMNEKGWAIAGIKNGDQLIGVIDRHQINSFLKS